MERALHMAIDPETKQSKRAIKEAREVGCASPRAREPVAP